MLLLELEDADALLAVCFCFCGAVGVDAALSEEVGAAACDYEGCPAVAIPCQYAVSRCYVNGCGDVTY